MWVQVCHVKSQKNVQTRSTLRAVQYLRRSAGTHTAWRPATQYLTSLSGGKGNNTTEIKDKAYIPLQKSVQCWEDDLHGGCHTPHRGRCSEGSYWGSETDEVQLEPGSRTDAQRCSQRHQEDEDQPPINTVPH